jgi:hypothetical protein
VSDFGIAKAKAASEATASVFIKGKPAYMSPEQANGQALDGRSDLFAVGVMLWEMLVGQRLFTAEDTRATLAAVLFGQIKRPRMLRAEIPRDLERVTMKLLEREPSARYSTAREAIDDLLACNDAPRNGPDLLRQVLAERYPHQMPMRQSAINARTPSIQPMPGSNPTNQVFSNAGGTPQQHATPSVSAKMAAQTSTMMPHNGASSKRMSMGARVGLIIGVTVVSAFLAFVIVSAARHKGGAVAAGSGVAIDAGVVMSVDAAPVKVAAVTPDAAVAVIDAAPPPPPVDAPAPPPVDAAPAGGHTVPPPPHAAKKEGTLVVTGFPNTEVYIGSRKVGETQPNGVRVKLAVGSVTVQLKAEDYNKSVPVEIKEGVVTPIHADH